MLATSVGATSKKRPLKNGSVETAEFIPLEAPTKRQKIFDEEESDREGSGEEALRINNEFARKFEHNKKRAELHKLEEKYGKAKLGSRPAKADDDSADESDEESSSETEDEEGVLATEALDQEIVATLNAIRSKEPRVFDENAKFYTEFDPGAETEEAEGKEKPMTLRDYHRRNLLNGDGVGHDEDSAPMSYAKQQEALKQTLVREMHDAAAGGEVEGDDDFLRPIKALSPAPRPAIPDTAEAERDPEKFLTDFLASRAWVPTSDSRFAALQSDNDEEYERAEEFELKYNLRFEDPDEVNRTLKSYARDAIAEKTVRREEKKARRRAREKERERKEAAKREREEERARLRKLKIDHIEEKVQMIRGAAGLHGKEFMIEEWAEVLDADWDDDRWDQEMSKRFGEAYYQAQEEVAASGEDDEAGGGTKRRTKLKKPRWSDDIDINDLIPEFNESEAVDPALRLTDEEDQEKVDDGVKSWTKAARSAKTEAKAAQRRHHRIISALVDQNLPLDVDQPGAKASETFTPFRYRDTSPSAFGLTPLDILAATDAQLNQYAGLKKLATFRDPERKRRDKKKLGKKARLRQWRKEAFGREDGPDRDAVFAPSGIVDGDEAGDETQRGLAGEDYAQVHDDEKRKKRRRGKKRKMTDAALV